MRAFLQGSTQSHAFTGQLGYSAPPWKLLKSLMNTVPCPWCSLFMSILCNVSVCKWNHITAILLSIHQIHIVNQSYSDSFRPSNMPVRWFSATLRPNGLHKKLVFGEWFWHTKSTEYYFGHAVILLGAQLKIDRWISSAKLSKHKLMKNSVKLVFGLALMSVHVPIL